MKNGKWGERESESLKETKNVGGIGTHSRENVANARCLLTKISHVNYFYLHRDILALFF